MAHDIFISYSHKDKTVADAICSHLESNGMRCWYAPRDIPPGSEWGVEILKGIEAAKIMVLVFTKDANLSQQVLREVNNAVNCGLAIIPFRLTEEEPTAGMKYYLSTVHWMDAMNDDLDTSIHTLGNLCRAVLEKKPVPITPSGASNAVGTAGASSGAEEGTGTKSGSKKIGTGAVAAIIAVAVIGVIAVVLLLGRGGKNTAGDSGEAGENTASVSSVPTDENDGNESSTGNDLEAAGENSSSEDAGAEETVTPAAEESSAITSIEYEENTDFTLNLGAVSENVSSDLSETYTRGNNQSNLQNGGYLAYDGEYYYYVSNDGGKMYRMKEDGSDITKLTDCEVGAISVVDGYVYFVESGYGLRRIKTDGSGYTELTDDADETARIVGDRIYFVEYGLSSVAIDGSDRQVYSDKIVYMTVLDGTYQYYADPNYSSYLFRAKMDGTQAECIYDHEVLSLRIAGNYLYFYDSDDGWEMSYDLSTGETMRLFADPANSPVITKDGIYAESGNLQLEFVPFGAMGVKIFTDEWVGNINVAGNKIFYFDKDNEKYCMIDLDGSNKMET